MHSTGISRREIVQVGYSGMVGLGLPTLFERRASGAPRAEKPQARRARTVLFIYLTGAPSHIDTFDPKPEAPAEIRGTLGATVYSALGIDPESLVVDQVGRPLQLNHGSVIQPLYNGATS